MATHSSILSWRIPWTEEPGRLQSMACVISALPPSLRPHPSCFLGPFYILMGFSQDTFSEGSLFFFSDDDDKANVIMLSEFQL